MAEARRVPFVSLPTDAVVILDEEEKKETNNTPNDRQREPALTPPAPQPRREAGEQRPSQHETPMREASAPTALGKELQHKPPTQREPETRHCPTPRALPVTSAQPEEHRPLQREAESSSHIEPPRALLRDTELQTPPQQVPGVTSETRPEQEARHFAQQCEAGGAAVEPAGEPPLKQRRTVRLELTLKDPTEEGCSEYNYPELLGGCRQRGRAAGPATPQKKPLLSDDPFNDDERERQQVETLAKKFEVKYGGKVHKHRKDRMQDLIDIGYGYDETDPFIDNSEAYDELVPASLTTKHGGFYINTGTLQFRQTSDSEDDDFVGNKKSKPLKVLKLQDGEDRTMKKRKRKEEGSDKEKKPRKLKVPNQLGVMSLNSHKSEKKKKKHKDPLALAAMIRKFEMEKDAIKKELTQDPPLLTVVNATSKTTMAARNELSDLSLGCDPVLSIFGSTSERELLQEAENALEMLGDLDFDKLLDAASNDSPLSDAGEENGILGHNVSHDLSPKQIPDLPEGLPAHLERRIEDLRVAAKLFDEEGRKKFFTQDMNNILLDIELQLQELSTSSRNGVYSHIEAFVPCNKDSLIKRLKKLHLNVQDDRLREPLQRFKIAVSNILPLQISSFQDHCLAYDQAKSAKVQAGEVEKNGSEEDDEKPGKRVTGPRKKFLWDERLRDLLCNLVKIKLSCYELEPNKSQSAEDYLKNFMETELRPLWPKGWMQARMLLKECRSVHIHLTSATAKKKVTLAPKPKTKDPSPKKEQKTSTPLVTSTRVSAPIPVTPISIHSSSSCIPASETICLDDSLDDDLPFNPPSLDSVTDALSVLNNGTKTAGVSSSLDTPTSRPRSSLREDKLATIMSKLPLGAPKKVEPAQAPHSSSLIAGHSGSIPKKPNELAAHAAIASGLIAGSSIQNPKVSIEPLPAKLLQQGLQRSVQAQVSSSTSAQAQVSSSTPSVSQTQVTTSLSSTSSQPQVSSSSSQPEGSSLTTSHQQTVGQQNYVSPLQVTVSKSQANPVVRLTNSPNQCSSPVTKMPEKHRHTSSSPAPGHSPQVSQTLVSRTSSSSTSTNYLTKAMGNLSSSMGFKSPYTMASSCKTTTSPSSSSPSILVAQSTSHQKQSGSSNINLPSPAINIFSSNQSTGFQPVKVPQTSPKITSSAAPKMANQTAPKMTNSAAPKVINPPATKVASPAPQKSFNTAAPKVSNPAAPKVSNPSAPKVSNPAAPKVSNPVAPKVSNPTAPKVSIPATPKVSNSVAPKMPNSVAPKMPNPIASKMPSPVAPKMTNPPPKLPSPPPKMASPAPRLPSPAPKLPSTTPKLPNQAPKMPSPSPKPLNPVSKPPSPAPNPPSPAPKSTSPAPKLNTSSPGTICRNNMSRVNLNVPIRSNLNSSSGANRTNLPSGGTQGATKLLNPHRPSSSSGSPVTAAIVQPTTGSALLATNSHLTLMTSPLSVTSPNAASSPLAPFSMLSGLVPVTVPFQFPLGLLGFGSDAVTTSSGTTSAVFHHSLAQNLLKGLQTSTQNAATISHTALPSHLQQVFTDGGQSKGDAKLQRKTQ